MCALRCYEAHRRFPPLPASRPSLRDRGRKRTCFGLSRGAGAFQSCASQSCFFFSEAGEWDAATGVGDVPACPGHRYACCFRLGPLSFGFRRLFRHAFLRGGPLFPLAADVLAQSRDWVALGIGETCSGYHTGVSKPAPAGNLKAAPKKAPAKRQTLAALAAQQTALADLVTALTTQVEVCQGSAPGSVSDRTAPFRCPASPAAPPQALATPRSLPRTLARLLLQGLS